MMTSHILKSLGFTKIKKSRYLENEIFLFQIKRFINCASRAALWQKFFAAEVTFKHETMTDGDMHDSHIKKSDLNSKRFYLKNCGSSKLVKNLLSHIHWMQILISDLIYGTSREKKLSHSRRATLGYLSIKPAHNRFPISAAWSIQFGYFFDSGESVNTSLWKWENLLGDTTVTTFRWYILLISVNEISLKHPRRFRLSPNIHSIPL